MADDVPVQYVRARRHKLREVAPTERPSQAGAIILAATLLLSFCDA